MSIFIICLGVKLANAGEVRIAVASNFLKPMKDLAHIYTKETGNQVKVSSGSTGKLYTQILHGAPYDIFFAASSSEPEKLVSKGLGIDSSRFTYAIGRVLLWSKSHNLGNVSDLKRLISEGKVQTLAIANAKTAPYGYAAEEILKNLFDTD